MIRSKNSNVNARARKHTQKGREKQQQRKSIIKALIHSTRGGLCDHYFSTQPHLKPFLKSWGVMAPVVDITRFSCALIAEEYMTAVFILDTQVIPAFEEAVSGMSPGGVRR